MANQCVKHLNILFQFKKLRKVEPIFQLEIRQRDWLKLAGEKIRREQVGTVPTFLSVRANKFAKWKIGFRTLPKNCILEMCKSDPKPIRIRSDRIFSDFGSSKIISDRIG